MSRWDESYEQRRDREREERREFEGDVFYDAWRRGLDPDRAVQCADDCREAGRTPEQCVDGLAQRERDRREARLREEEAFARYEEDGPMDLEDQLEHALDAAFPGNTGGQP
jgi:hypothetical protein